MASIESRPRPSGTAYRVRWSERRDGVGHRRSREFSTLDAATDFARAVERRPAHAWPIEASARITFAEVADRCLALAINTQSDTRERQRRMLSSRVLPRLGHLEFTHITPEDVLQVVLDLQRDDLSPKTVKNHVDLVSQVIRFGVRRGLRPDNPCHFLPMKGLRDQASFPVRTILTSAEARLLVDACPGNSALMVTLLGTGMRWGEASALQVRDVQLDSARPLLNVTKAWKRAANGQVLGLPKSRNAIRQVPVPDGLVQILKQAVDGRGAMDFLFTDSAGRPWTHNRYYRRMWLPALSGAQAAGLSKSPRLHDLRHTYAAWVMEEAPMYAAYKLLGHATSQTTADLYGGLTTSLQDRVVQQIDQMVFGAKSNGADPDSANQISI